MNPTLENFGKFSEPIFFVCNDFERALGLERIFPDYHIICIDYNTGLEAARAQGVKIFCLEEELKTINPIFRNSNRLLNHPSVIEYIKKESGYATPNVIFFKIAPNIEASCKKLGFKLLNTSADLNHKFELKLSQYEEIEKLGYFPSSIVGILQDLNYSEVVQELGEPFVIQYDRGHTGSSTVFIENSTQFDQEVKLFPKRKAKISSKIDGEPWTLNACITRYGVTFGGLCFQITGIEGCTSKKGGTVGNDWTQTKRLPSSITEQIANMTTRIGEHMKKSGYIGLFGLDIIVDSTGKAFLIEINARQPASTGMHTKLMLANQQIPLQLLHIAEFLYGSENYLADLLYLLQQENSISHTKIDSKETSNYPSEQKHIETDKEVETAEFTKYLYSQNIEAMKPIEASQLIIRNTSIEDLTISKELQTGVYLYSDGDIKKIRDGYCIEDITDENEFLLLAGGKGRVITPESEIARIQAKSSILENTSRDEIVRLIKSKLI